MDKKNKIKQLIDDVASIFKFDAATGSADTETPAETAGEPKQVTLADGTICNIPDGMEPGATITALTAEGETPLAAGEYPLEDGSIIVVKEAGIIADVMTKVAEVSAEATNEEFEAFKAEVNALIESKFQAVTEELAATKKANDVLIAKFKEAGEKVAELTLEFKSIAEAVPAPITPSAPAAPKTEAEKLQAYFSKQN